MVQRKKFDEGGSVMDRVFDHLTGKDTRSVMDKPVQDMRDPEYRKELEYKQALETSTPELDLMGAGAMLRKAATRAATKDALAERTGKALKDIPDTTSSRDEFLRERMRAQAKASEKATRNRDLKAATKQTGKAILGSAGNAIVNTQLAEGRNEFVRNQLKKEREQEEKSDAAKRGKYGVAEDYKRGGKVSASSRGDGIAKRGKTRGRLV